MLHAPPAAPIILWYFCKAAVRRCFSSVWEAHLSLTTRNWCHYGAVFPSQQAKLPLLAAGSAESAPLCPPHFFIKRLLKVDCVLPTLDSLPAFSLLPYIVWWKSFERRVLRTKQLAPYVWMLSGSNKDSFLFQLSLIHFPFELVPQQSTTQIYYVNQYFVVQGSGRTMV